MALCDGASASIHSNIGASCIAEFSAGYFAEHFDHIYHAEFNATCEALIQYHQGMISRLSEVACEKKGVRILTDNNIRISELNKFASSVQVLAVKDDRAVYFKVGNGSAVMASEIGVSTLSDSVVQEPPLYVTAHYINMLVGCDFKTFTIPSSVYAVSLATDGVEFETGLFHDHSATLFYENVLNGVADGVEDPDAHLKKVAGALLADTMNPCRDNVGISVMYRERMEVLPEAPVEDEITVEIVEEPIEEEITVEIVEEPIEEEITVEIVEEPIEDEITVEIAEEPVEEEITVEIVDEPIEEETAVEIVEEPIEDEITVEIVDEPIEDETTVEIVEEPVEEETAVEIVDEPIEEETAVEIVEEPIEEETAVEIVEEPVEEEITVEIVEEPIEEETTVEIVDEPVEDEAESEEFAIEIVDDSEDGDSEMPAEDAVEIRMHSENDEDAVKILKPVSTVQSDTEKKVTKTIFKLFSVSIKKK